MKKAAKTFTLTGMYFHILNDDGRINKQGTVLGRIDDHHYMVVYFEWLMGGPSDMCVVTVVDMRSWLFYETAEQMQDYCEHAPQARRLTLRAQEVVGEILERTSEHGDRERKFRIGAHHAVTRLAEALETCKSIEEARVLADAYADAIGAMRSDIGRHFDVGEVLHQVRAGMGDPK